MSNPKKFQIRTTVLRPDAVLNDSEVVVDRTPGRASRLYVGKEGVKVRDLKYYVASDDPLLGGALQPFFAIKSGSVNAAYYPDGTANGKPKYTKAGGDPLLDRTLWDGGAWSVFDDGQEMYLTTDDTPTPTTVQDWIAGSGELPLPSVTNAPTTDGLFRGTMQEVLEQIAISCM